MSEECYIEIPLERYESLVKSETVLNLMQKNRENGERFADDYIINAYFGKTKS